MNVSNSYARKITIVCWLLVFVFLIALLEYYFHKLSVTITSLSVMGTLPFFRLCASGSSGDDGDSSGCGDGSSDGGSCGSTPFICTWNGKKFEFENDILFGQPSSYFLSAEIGRNEYESGNITGDLYRIQNSFKQKDDTLAFQLKEIEPEESYFDTLSLKHVVFPKNTNVFADASFKQLRFFDKDAVKKQEGILSQKIYNRDAVEISSISSQVINDEEGDKTFQELEADDFVKITGVVRDSSKPLFLLMKSHYRDWTLDTPTYFDGSKKDDMESFVSAVRDERDAIRGFPFSVTRVSKSVLFVLALAVSFVVGNVLRLSNPVNNDEHIRTQGLSDTFSVVGSRSVYADTPSGCSLEIAYYDGSVYKDVVVVKPRYYQPNVDAIEIPKEAVGREGEVTIRVRATKKHYVYSLSLLSTEENRTSVQDETLNVEKAYHERLGIDYAPVLQKEQSKEYLPLIPSDIVQVEFNQPSLVAEDAMQEAYFINAAGFYANMSLETQSIVGDWMSRLEPESREWLQNMRSLSEYSKEKSQAV